MAVCAVIGLEIALATMKVAVPELIGKDQKAMADHGQWLARLDASIARSLDDFRAGRVESAEAVFDRLSAKYKALARERETR